jgi:outer membrane protein assembly factor BamB
MYAFYPNGTTKWEILFEGGIYSSPAIDHDGTIYIGSWDKYIYAINPNGTIKWKFETFSFIQSSPAIDQNGTIYIGSRDHHLYALYPNGTLKWRYMTELEIFSSPTIGKDGTIYIGSDDFYLYAIKPNGTLKWRFETGGYVRGSPALGPDGTIYIGSADKNFYAVDLKGLEKWAFSTGKTIRESPAIGSEGTIFIGSDDGIIYSLNPDGSLKWKFETAGGGGTISSPAIGSDGSLYVSSFFLIYSIGGHSTSTNLPSPPENLELSINDHSMVLVWDPPLHDGGSEVTMYKIFRGTKEGSEKYLDSVDREITTYNDTTTTNNLRYFYYVTAINSVGESDESNNVSGTYIETVAPTISEVISGDGFVKIYWESPPGKILNIINYTLYRGLDNNKIKFFTDLHKDTRDFNDTNITNGKTYYYYVTGSTKVAESLPSRIINATPIARPSPPCELTVNSGDGFVELTWLPPENASEDSVTLYKIYRGPSPGEETLIVTQNRTTDSYQTYRDEDVKNDKKYFYYITAINAGGESNASKRIKTTPTKKENIFSLPGFEPLIVITSIMVIIVIKRKKNV